MTDHWAGLTASMKNFFGVVPGAVYGWPKNLLHVNGIPMASSWNTAETRGTPAPQQEHDQRHG